MPYVIALAAYLMIFAGSGETVVDTTSAQQADPQIAFISGTHVNWKEGYAQASGIGFPPANKPGYPESRLKQMAQSAARNQAYAELARLIDGVQITATTTVADQRSQVEVVNTFVQSHIRGAIVMETHWRDDRSCEVVLRAPLDGEFFDAFEGHLPRTTDEWPELPDPPPTPPTEVGEKSAEPADPLATGVIVDGSGLPLKGGQRPRIYDEDGQAIFGGTMPGFVIGAGEKGSLVAYEFSIDDARQHSFAGAYPVVVTAVGVGQLTRDGRSIDIVLSTRDGRSLYATSLGLLQRSRVVVILPPINSGR